MAAAVKGSNNYNKGKKNQKSTKHSLFSIMTLKSINTSMIHYSTDST